MRLQTGILLLSLAAATSTSRGQNGACCDLTTGDCEIKTQAECENDGGSFKGAGTDCGPPNPCKGACCDFDGTCSVLSQEACVFGDGVYTQDGSTCDPNPCVKTVICISGDNSGFVNNHEGWIRKQRRGPQDVIQIGGNLTECLAQVRNGDTLIIIAHGAFQGRLVTGFVWHDGTNETKYFGFGDGQDDLPVPEGFADLLNITARFQSCWSARDVAPLDLPLVTRLINAMGGGQTHTGTGHNDLLNSREEHSFSGGTKAQKLAALACLRDNPAWMRNPPVNRLGLDGRPVVPNQQTAAQALVDACDGAGGAGTVKVAITSYREPVGKVDPPGPASGADGCACEDLPGCGFGLQAGRDCGDLDWNGYVDISDFARFAMCFSGAGVTLRPPLCPPEDFDGADCDNDEDVDLIDYLTFSANYGQ